MDEGSDLGVGGGMQQAGTTEWSTRDGLPALTLAPLGAASHRHLIGDIAAATAALEAPHAAGAVSPSGSGGGARDPTMLPPAVLPGLPTLTPADTHGPFTVSRMMGMGAGMLTAGSGGLVSVGAGTGGLTGALGFGLSSTSGAAGSGAGMAGGVWSAAASSIPSSAAGQLPMGSVGAPSSPAMGPLRSPMHAPLAPSPRFARAGGGSGGPAPALSAPGGMASPGGSGMLPSSGLLSAHLTDASPSPGGGNGGSRLVFPFPLSQVTPEYIRGLLEGVDTGVALARLEALGEAMRANRASLALQHRHMDLLQQALLDAYAALQGGRRPSGMAGSGDTEYR
jgi:hypothetical protein